MVFFLCDLFVFGCTSSSSSSSSSSYNELRGEYSVERDGQSICQTNEKKKVCHCQQKVNNLVYVVFVIGWYDWLKHWCHTCCCCCCCMRCDIVEPPLRYNDHGWMVIGYILKKRKPIWWYRATNNIRTHIPFCFISIYIS